MLTCFRAATKNIVKCKNHRITVQINGINLYEQVLIMLNFSDFIYKVFNKL